MSPFHEASFGSDVIIDSLPFLSTWSLSIILKALWRVNIILCVDTRECDSKRLMNIKAGLRDQEIIFLFIISD